MGDFITFDRELFRKRIEEVTNLKKKQDIAERLHISPQTYSKWRSGESTPKIDDLIYIALEFNCSIDYLLGVDQESRERYPRKYTARDVCRILTEIDRQYVFDMRQELDITRERGDDDLVLISSQRHTKADELINKYLNDYYKIRTIMGSIIKQFGQEKGDSMISAMLNPIINKIPEIFPDTDPESDPNFDPL